MTELNDIPDVCILGGHALEKVGNAIYIVLAIRLDDIREVNPPLKTILVISREAHGHEEVMRQFNKEHGALWQQYWGNQMGGGYISFRSDNKTWRVYGESGSYGQGKQAAVEILQRAFPDHQIK